MYVQFSKAGESFPVSNRIGNNENKGADKACLGSPLHHTERPKLAR
uniref:Uncharacterized protein n=1 Tax=Anguilla anguilla TaxID=7936 RepID=A0A0E9U0V4_ANGAN